VEDSEECGMDMPGPSLGRSMASVDNQQQIQVTPLRGGPNGIGAKRSDNERSNRCYDAARDIGDIVFCEHDSTHGVSNY